MLKSIDISDKTALNPSTKFFTYFCIHLRQIIDMLNNNMRVFMIHSASQAWDIWIHVEKYDFLKLYDIVFPLNNSH